MSIEARPLDCGCGACVDCSISGPLRERWPDIGCWSVVGEGVVRGQWFVRDLWRYVMVSDHRYVDVTGEALDDNEAGFHDAALRAISLVGSRRGDRTDEPRPSA